MKRIVLISIALLIGMALNAQGDSKVNSGILKIDQGDFAKGVELIETGLSLGANPKKLAKAYSKLAFGYFQMSNDSATMANNPDILFKAQKAVEKTKELDEKGRFTKGSFLLAENGLHRNMFNVGATAYNNKDYAKSLPFLKGSSELVPDNILYKLLLGYAQVSLGDSASAITSLQGTLDSWNATEESARDSALLDNIRSTNLMLATLYNQYEKKPKKALKVLEDARTQFPTDQDLRNTELGIYQQNPQLFEDARSKFEKALTDDPKNNIVKLAYAQLLTQNGEKEKGLKLYNEVLESDPKNYQANVNIGAFYINEAVSIQKAYEETSSNEEDKLAELEKSFLSLLNKAYPHMKNAHEAAPDNLDWVNQLVIISTTVPELLGDTKIWLEKKKALTGGN